MRIAEKTTARNFITLHLVNLTFDLKVDLIDPNMKDHFLEKYIELENNPYLLGRISVNQVKEDFHAEVDIIHRESHKIFKHVDIVYHQPSAEEAIIVGVQRLRQFIESLTGPKDETFH
jgi:hypothetical protein